MVDFYAGTFNMHTPLIRVIIVGVGKERRILIGPGGLPRQHPFGTIVRFTGPVPAGGLSAANAIGTQLRDPIKLGTDPMAYYGGLK